MAIWSPVTWLHQNQIEDDYLLFNTLKVVCEANKVDFYEVAQYYINEDQELVEKSHVQNRRAAMVYDLDYRYQEYTTDKQIPEDL